MIYCILTQVPSSTEIKFDVHAITDFGLKRVKTTRQTDNRIKTVADHLSRAVYQLGEEGWEMIEINTDLFDIFAKELGVDTLLVFKHP